MRVDFYEEDHVVGVYEEDQFYDASPYFVRTRRHVQSEEEGRIQSQTRNETLMRRERYHEERNNFDMNNRLGDVRNNYDEFGENRQNLMQSRTGMNTRNEQTHTTYSRRPYNIRRMII